eukprot:365168-Chlamydomonas_euryale.AAC.1
MRWRAAARGGDQHRLTAGTSDDQPERRSLVEGHTLQCCSSHCDSNATYTKAHTRTHDLLHVPNNATANLFWVAFNDAACLSCRRCHREHACQEDSTGQQADGAAAAAVAELLRHGSLQSRMGRPKGGWADGSSLQAVARAPVPAPRE